MATEFELKAKGDFSDIEKGTKSIDKLSDSASKAEKSTKNLGGAIDGLKGVKGPVGEAANAFGEMKDKVEGVASSFGGMSTRVVAAIGVVGGAVAALAVFKGAIAEVTAEMRDLADKADEQAQKFGISIQRLEQLTLIAKENGGSVEALVKTYDKLSKSMNKADEDNAKTSQAFKVLGLSQDDLAKQTEAQVAGTIIKNWEDLGRTSKATAATMILLGPAFRESVPAIKEAAAASDEYLARIRKFGSDASPALVKAGGEQEQALSNLGLAWKGVKNEVAESQGGMVISLTNWAAEMLAKIRGVMKEWRESNAAMNARTAAVPQDVTNKFRNQAKGEVDQEYLAGTGPYPTFGEVEKRTKELVSSYQRSLFQASERASYGGIAEGLAEAARVAKLKKTSEDTPLTPPKDDGSAKRAADEQARLQEHLKKILQDQNLELLKSAGFDTDRIKLARDLDETLSKITGMTKQQKDDAKAIALSSYDQAKAAEDAKKVEEAITAEKKKQLEAVTGLIIKSKEFTAKERSEFDNRFQPKIQRDAAKTELQATSGFDAAIDKGQQELLDPSKTDAQKAGIEQYIQTLRQYRAEALQSIKTLNTEKAAAENTIEEGVGRGLTNYLDSIPSRAQTVADAVKGIASTMEDAFVKLATTGKLSFRDLTKTVLAQIAQIYAKMVATQLIGMFVGAFTGGGTAGAGSSVSSAGSGLGATYAAKGEVFGALGILRSANGNVFDSPTLHTYGNGKLGVIGEKGPEGVLPLKRGADGVLGVQLTGGSAGGTTQINNNITISIGSVDSPDRAQELKKSVGDIVEAKTKQVMAEQMRKGGMLNPVR